MGGDSLHVLLVTNFDWTDSTRICRQPAEELLSKETRYGELAYTFSNCVLSGLKRKARDGKVDIMLRPPTDTLVKKTDELILFSDSFDVKRCSPPDLSRVPKLCASEEDRQKVLSESSNILLCGWRQQWDDVTTFFTRLEDMSEMVSSTLHLTLINMKPEEAFDALFNDYTLPGTGALRPGWTKERHRIINTNNDGFWERASMDTVRCLQPQCASAASVPANTRLMILCARSRYRNRLLRSRRGARKDIHQNTKLHRARSAEHTYAASCLFFYLMHRGGGPIAGLVNPDWLVNRKAVGSWANRDRKPPFPVRSTKARGFHA